MFKKQLRTNGLLTCKIKVFTFDASGIYVSDDKWPKDGFVYHSKLPCKNKRFSTVQQDQVNPHIAQIHTWCYTPPLSKLAAGITAVTEMAFFRIIQ